MNNKKDHSEYRGQRLPLNEYLADSKCRMNEFNCGEKSIWPVCVRALTSIVLIFMYKFYFKKSERAIKQLRLALCYFSYMTAIFL